MKHLVLGCGVLCAVMGATLILLKDKIEGLLWFGIAIQVLGMALIWMVVRKRKPVDTTKPPKSPGVWFPVSLVVIHTLQFAYLLWWAKSGR